MAVNYKLQTVENKKDNIWVGKVNFGQIFSGKLKNLFANSLGIKHVYKAKLSIELYVSEPTLFISVTTTDGQDIDLGSGLMAGDKLELEWDDSAPINRTSIDAITTHFRAWINGVEIEEEGLDKAYYINLFKEGSSTPLLEGNITIYYLG